MKQDFLKEEIRSGFLVTEKRKKIWAVELQLLEKFDEVCKKHNIQYFAGYGTLLGAVRHQGFIPWDDDIDVVMFRDEYEKLLKIGKEEFTEPFYFQNAHTDNMPEVFSKLRDSRTTAIEHPDRPDLNQGIFIDIFPLDDAYEKDSAEQKIVEVQKIIYLTIIKPDYMREVVSEGIQTIVSEDIILDLLDLPLSERMKEFETFNLTHFGKTDYVNLVTEEILQRTSGIRREWFQETVYLPFEQTMVPVPAGYEKVLECMYGDWKKCVITGGDHNILDFDPDIPYTEYFNK